MENLSVEGVEQIEKTQNNTSEVVQVENLKKRYKNITALDGVSFSVKKGEVFGLLGPNGAGKTTTINILCTLSQPNSGQAYVNGYDVVRQPAAVRDSIGLVFQETILDSHLTAEENLYLHAMLYGVSRKEYLERKRDLLKFCELWGKRKAKVETFSGGMKRRLELVRALIHNPQVLFLDEPTIGLDPQTRKKIWDYIFSLRKKKNITIFLTTQYLSEAENCDRVAILDHGVVVSLDSPENLKRMIGEDIISFRTEDNQVAEQEFREKFPKFPIKRVGKELRVKVNNGDKFLPILVKAVTPRIISMELRRPTLEDVFLEITGRKIREDNKEINKEEEKFDLSSLFSIFGSLNKKDE
ncbi:MAG: ATP-binding cassette domain-containing protein [Candidatus Paceibacterota bacterium]|jgi:ABC-2 type transport system ATP-binding protein